MTKPLHPLLIAILLCSLLVGCGPSHEYACCECHCTACPGTWEIQARPGAVLDCDATCADACSDSDFCEAGSRVSSIEDCSEAMDTGEAGASDRDGDGWPDENDCDPDDPAINPYADELCNGLDDDCDGLVDDEDDDVEDPVSWYADVDADGYGSSEDLEEACEQPEGFTSDASDCDDMDSAVHPGAVDWYDGEDGDCDGVVDVTTIGGADGKLAGDDYQFLGYSVSGGGDLDGDGYDDIAAGAYCDDAVGDCSGAVFVLYGGQAGAIAGELDSSGLADRLLGEASNASAGTLLSMVGDQDGDGRDDLIVGAVQTGSSSWDENVVYVVSGPVQGRTSLASADARLVAGGEDVGWPAVAGAGDLDGDGTHDLALGLSDLMDWGSHEEEGLSGEVYIYMDAPGLEGDAGSLADTTLTPSGDDLVVYELGRALAGPGDLDGDGLADLVVGANSGTGAALVFSGELLSGGGELPSSACMDAWQGENTYDQAGEYLSPAGDADGDGLPDFWIGAAYQDEGGSEAGALYLVTEHPGAISGLADATAKLVHDVSGDYAGVHAGGGDFDGDGHSDLLVGVPTRNGTHDQSAGKAYLAFGRFEGTLTLAEGAVVWHGERNGDRLGVSVAMAGDVDGDGLGDVLLGADWESSGGTYGGAAYLVLGRSP